MNVVRKSLLSIMKEARTPYTLKILYEIHQICKELGVASNEANYINGYITLIGRQKNGQVKYEAHIQCLDEGRYNVYFSAFHDRPFKIGVKMGYDINGHPYIEETFD